MPLAKLLYHSTERGKNPKHILGDTSDCGKPPFDMKKQFRFGLAWPDQAKTELLL